jgi:hypothetical protein
MAQPSRKRRSKHRGNAAGMVEARGRTSRPMSADEKKRVARETARDKRRNTPPTWKSAFKKGGLATVFVFIALLVIGGKGTIGHKLPGAAVGAVAALMLYTAFGYYLDLFMYRRYLAKHGTARR